MSGAKSIECKCTDDFTCGYCLRNAKPWFYTLSDGSAIYDVPFQGVAKNKERIDRLEKQ
jgi:hypothetical protein